MRPLVPKKQTRMHSLNRMIFIGLIAGVTISALIWLQVPNQILSPIYWISLGAVGLLGLMILRRRGSQLRWLSVLAAVVAVCLAVGANLFEPCAGIPSPIWLGLSALFAGLGMRSRKFGLALVLMLFLARSVSDRAAAVLCQRSWVWGGKECC